MHVGSIALIFPGKINADFDGKPKKRMRGRKENKAIYTSLFSLSLSFIGQEREKKDSTDICSV